MHQDWRKWSCSARMRRAPVAPSRDVWPGLTDRREGHHSLARYPPSLLYPPDPLIYAAFYATHMFDMLQESLIHDLDA
jgi:hypothetical protein